MNGGVQRVVAIVYLYGPSFSLIITMGVNSSLKNVIEFGSISVSRKPKKKIIRGCLMHIQTYIQVRIRYLLDSKRFCSILKYSEWLGLLKEEEQSCHSYWKKILLDDGHIKCALREIKVGIPKFQKCYCIYKPFYEHRPSQSGFWVH